MEGVIILQDVLRMRFLKYLGETGVKQNFVAEKVNLPVSVLSRFKTYQKDLSVSSYDTLDKYLNRQGY